MTRTEAEIRGHVRPHSHLAEIEAAAQAYVAAFDAHAAERDLVDRGPGTRVKVRDLARQRDLALESLRAALEALRAHP